MKKTSIYEKDLHMKKASAKKTCSRGHVYSGPGPCPICWPNGRKKTKKRS